MPEILWVLFLIFLKFVLPLIVLVGLVVGVRLYLRGRRERESLEALRAQDSPADPDSAAREARFKAALGKYAAH